LFKIFQMKIKKLKTVFSTSGFRNEGEVHDIDPKTARHYISRGIGIEFKEEKIEKETKEFKPKRKYTKRKK